MVRNNVSKILIQNYCLKVKFSDPENKVFGKNFRVFKCTCCHKGGGEEKETLYLEMVVNAFSSLGSIIMSINIIYVYNDVTLYSLKS